jgi:cobyrinic acid a,c-diamide synthase
MHRNAVACPALLIDAPASGQGKTSVTAALARLHSRRGRRVRVFKCGPDVLDPHWHELASGHTLYCSKTESTLEPVARTTPARAHAKAEALYGGGALRASYFHAWFASNAEATANAFPPEAA